MREVTIDAGDNRTDLPTHEKIKAVYLKGVRRPFPMVRMTPTDFDKLEKESYAHNSRGIPQFYCLRMDPMPVINILPRPNGKVTIMLEYPEENVRDGYDTTWKRQRGPA